MQSKNSIKTVVDYFSCDNFEKIYEEAQIIKKIYCQDFDGNYGRMTDYLEYLKICDNNQLKISIRETTLISGSRLQVDLIKSIGIL